MECPVIAFIGLFVREPYSNDQHTEIPNSKERLVYTNFRITWYAVILVT